MKQFSARLHTGARHPAGRLHRWIAPLGVVWGAALLLTVGALAQEQDGEPGHMPEALKDDHVAWTMIALTKGDPSVLSAFASVVSNAAPSVVTILVDDRPVALGTVVDSGGLLLTKASLLNGDGITCRLADGRHVHAAVLSADDEQDLALLKIAAAGLKPVMWREADVPSAGHWVITPGASRLPVAVGVVSTAPRSWRMRRRDKPRGFLGVQLEAGESNTVNVVRVLHGLAADKAGIRVGDVIARVDSDTMTSVEQLMRKLGGTPPNTTVAIDVIRSEETLSISATLGEMEIHSPELHWGGGPLSERRYGFTNVLPHDTILQPDQCGGPLLDEDGRAIGINIARALRVASYALVAQDVQRTLQELKAKAPSGIEVSAEPIGDRPSPTGTAADTGGTEGDDREPGQGNTPPDSIEGELLKLWVKAVHDHDAEAVADVTRKFIERYPDRKAQFMVRSAQVFLGVLHDHARGYALARGLADAVLKTEGTLLNEMSWFILTDPRVENRDLDCAMALVRLAVKRSRGRDAAILDTLARGHFELGDLEKAIKTQTRAVKQAEGQTRAVIEETLTRYKRARRSI